MLKLTCALVFAGVAVSAMGLRAPASAVTCANGVYRAGCVGPNGATAVTKTPAATPVVKAYKTPAVTCANGVYRAGCAGPNGAAVVRRP
ncbi:MAG TPA: hypothetical protein VHS58_15060 [Acetobacteraceae bacterium]|jgi:hypothetical protein|nr:hypothetical protein [Acetobacteraceae bacterium]